MSINQEFILIKVSDAPGHLPSGFTDEIYTEGRVKRIGIYEEKLITSEKFKVRYDNLYQQRLVQAITYDRYNVVFLRKESYNVEILHYAEQIKIFDYTDNSEHHARVLDITTEQIQGSAFQKITIEYYDTNTYNYFNGTNVVNMLRSDSLIDRFTESQLNKVFVYLSAFLSYNFYSPFESEYFVENENINEAELNGLMINSRITQKTKRRVTLYLNEQDAYELQYYGSLANNYTYTMYFSEATNHKALERPTIEITKETAGVNLYKAVVTITTAVNNKYIYA